MSEANSCRQEESDDQWVELPDDLLEEFMADHVGIVRGILRHYLISGLTGTGGKLQCMICEKIYSTENLMRAHFERVHQEDAEDWMLAMQDEDDLDGMRTFITETHDNRSQRISP